MRSETRRERYLKKLPGAVKLPIRVAVVNLQCDQNLAYIIRAAACFGLDGVDVIGFMPERSKLREDSGSTIDFVDIKVYTGTAEFLRECEGRQLLAAEILDHSTPLETSKINFDKPTTFVVGNETLGVPESILQYADYVLQVNMPGVGYCLNTAQTANIFAYELVRQYSNRL